MTNQYVNKLILGNDVIFDISGDTATAADVAQGKTFHLASGAPAVGTASGGGGTPIVAGHIRGDAELAKSWTYDKLIHADEGITIPAYTTTSQTLKSGSALTSESLNFADYSYILLFRSLATPIYSNSANSAGRQIYTAYSGYMPMVFVPSSAFDYDGTAAGATTNVPQFNALNVASFTRVVYYSSATSVRFQSNTSYGANFGALSAPSVTIPSTSPYDKGTLSITSQNFTLRGSSTYLNSTNWGYMTDIRYQYIYELWRVPQSNSVHGWEVESQFRHILECANGTGTLT